MRATYLLVLAFIIVCTLPLEVFLRTRVYARWRRLLLSLAPVFVVFCGWDIYAVARHQWSFHEAQLSGVVLPGRLPLEEVLFFVVVPIASILTLEAVRAVKGWKVGDEQ